MVSEWAADMAQEVAQSINVQNVPPAEARYNGTGLHVYAPSEILSPVWSKDDTFPHETMRDMSTLGTIEELPGEVVTMTMAGTNSDLAAAMSTQSATITEPTSSLSTSLEPGDPSIIATSVNSQPDQTNATTHALTVTEPISYEAPGSENLLAPSFTPSSYAAQIRANEETFGSSSHTNAAYYGFSSTQHDQAYYDSYGSKPFDKPIYDAWGHRKSTYTVPISVYQPQNTSSAEVHRYYDPRMVRYSGYNYDDSGASDSESSSTSDATEYSNSSEERRALAEKQRARKKKSKKAQSKRTETSKRKGKEKKSQNKEAAKGAATETKQDLNETAPEEANTEDAAHENTNEETGTVYFDAE